MNCSFCGNTIERGTESIFVTRMGKALYFCSSKCEKNLLNLRRRPRKTEWTKIYDEEKLIRIKAPHLLKPIEEGDIFEKETEKEISEAEEKIVEKPKKPEEKQKKKKEQKVEKKQKEKSESKKKK